MPSTKLLALGVLLVAGFPAGFCLSSGSAHYFAPDVIRAQPGGKGYHGAGSGGGGEGGGGGGGAEHDGGHEAAAAGGDQGGGGDKAAGPGSAQPAEAKPRPAPPAPAPSEADALRTLLAGNTLRNDRDRGAGDRYLSRRGWQGIGDRTTLVVRRWTVLNDQLCITGNEQTLSCETLTMAREAKPGLDLAAVLGSVTAASGAHYTVLRGNVAHLPEMVPLIDGRAPVAIARKGPPASTGPTALKALIGHSAAEATEGQSGLSGFHFGQDGAWIMAHPLVPAAHTATGGVRVTVGRWAVHGDTLCLDQPGLDLNRTCYRAQQWAGGAIRLTPTQAGGSLDLSILPDGA